MDHQSVTIDSISILIWMISIIGMLFSALVVTVTFAIKNIINGLKSDNKALSEHIHSSIDTLTKKIDNTADRAESYGKETRQSVYHAHNRITEHIERHHASAK